LGIYPHFFINVILLWSLPTCLPSFVTRQEAIASIPDESNYSRRGMLRAGDGDSPEGWSKTEAPGARTLRVGGLLVWH